MTRPLLPFDKRRGAKRSSRKAPLKVYSSIAEPSWEEVCLELAKARAKRTRVKRRNAKRAAANHERAYGEHADYIRSLPCCVCGANWPIEAAHTTTGGTGRKAGAETLVPLCGPWRITASEFAEGCHRELHRIGVKSFEKKYSVDLKSIAKKLFGERAE